MEEINCLIGIEHMDERVEYIYVNWNGHLEGVGRVLHHHFQKRENVLELIWTGSRQGLEGADLTPDTSNYKEAKVVANYKEFFEITDPRYPIKYYYVFTRDSSWAVNDRFQTKALFTCF